MIRKKKTFHSIFDVSKTSEVILPPFLYKN